MRVAMITDGAAVDQDTTDLAAALTRLGHEVVFHGSTEHGKPEQGDAGQGNSRRRNTPAPSLFADHWRTERPTVVHNRSRTAAAAAITAATDLAIPVVHSLRGTEDGTAGVAERDIALRADRVVASCHAELAQLVAGNVPRSRVSVVPHGVDVDHFTPEGDRQPIGRRHRLVAVGDLHPSSGFATAVAALAGLADTELVIAGAPAHGRHAGQLRKYARRLGVSDRLHLPGPVSRTALPSLLRSAHIVLATPWLPRFGITALEAAACGTTVVAAAIGGLPDTVVDRITGVLVSPHKPRELAIAVGKLLAHPLSLEQYGAAARDRAASRYSWDQIAIDTLAAYRHAGASADPVRRIPRQERAQAGSDAEIRSHRSAAGS